MQPSYATICEVRDSIRPTINDIARDAVDVANEIEYLAVHFNRLIAP